MPSSKSHIWIWGFVFITVFTAADAVAQPWYKLSLPDLPTEGHFGRDLAIVDDYLIVGAPGDTTRGLDAGAVAVFDLSTSGFPIRQKLLPDTRYRGHFGRTLEAAGPHLFIGEVYASKVHYLRRVSGTYEYVATVSLPSHDRIGQFGEQLALNGDWLFIGASFLETSNDTRQNSPLFVYRHKGAQWEYTNTILPDAWTTTYSSRWTACSSGSSLFVGSTQDTEAGNQAGALSIYELVDGDWLFQTKVLAPDAQEFDRLGFRLDCTEDEVVVSGDRGDVYSMRKEINGWTGTLKRILVPGPEAEVIFNIKLDGSWLYVTREEAYEQYRWADIVNLFVREREEWTFVKKILSPEGGEGEGFGISIATTPALLVFGAMYDDLDNVDPYESEGSVYLARKEAILPQPIPSGITDPSGAGYENIYPNPVSAIAILQITVAEASHVSVRLYDVLGRRIFDVVDTTKQPGTYDELIDVSNLPSGVYFYRISIGRLTATKPLTVVH